MTSRDDLLTVDMAVMDFMKDRPDAPLAQIIRAAVSAAEPLIRADEQAKTLEFCCDDTRPEILADLRAQVEAVSHAPGCPGDQGCWCPIHFVMQLLEGSLQ